MANILFALASEAKVVVRGTPIGVSYDGDAVDLSEGRFPKAEDGGYDVRIRRPRRDSRRRRCGSFYRRCSIDRHALAERYMSAVIEEELERQRQIEEALRNGW